MRTSVFDEDVKRFGAMHHPQHAKDDFVRRLTAKTRRAAKIEPAAHGGKKGSVWTFLLMTDDNSKNKQSCKVKTLRPDDGSCKPYFFVYG